MRNLILIYFFATLLLGQSLRSVTVKRVNVKGTFYFPVFSSDNSRLLVTGENYKGLFLIDLKNDKVKNISVEDGAGYKPKFTSDGKSVIYRTNFYRGIKKFHNVYKLNLLTGKKETLKSDARNITPPIKLSDGRVVVFKSFINLIKGNKINSIEKVVFVSGNKIKYFNGVNLTEFQPFGNGIYVWASLSPNGKNILFTYGDKGTFLMDTKGNILRNFGFAHAPKFSPDGKWIAFMRDKDDSYKFIASDIWIVSVKSGKKFKITDTSTKIEMYPEWSHDGSMLVFHTTKGEIFTAKLNFK